MKLALLGASGHGKVIAEIAELIGYNDVIFFDDAWPAKKQIEAWFIEGDTESLIARKNEFDACIVSIGKNSIRQEKQCDLQQQGLCFASFVHPNAVVSRYASVDVGSVIMAGAVVNAFTKIGRGCIVNTGATIDHDCVLDDFVHISPGAHLAGDVSISECSWVGIGASVKQGIYIGSNTIIGVGSVVISDIPADSVAVGIPAKIK
ncbi:MAG: sugar O-acyltransferase (sialic acid O-acetyltransferase NeuD family) [Candidatus Endobugula sp.]|jgi:sugar O-acyltransferase (sialic acid O-acetyltransferase NeuD family)